MAERPDDPIISAQLPGDVTTVAPGLNPDKPSNYEPSPSVSAVAPVIAQITGGDPGNTIAGVQSAQNTDNSLTGKMSQFIQTQASNIAAAFHTGVASGGSGIAIADRVEQLATQKAQAIFESGQAGAKVIAQDALARAAAKTQTDKDAILLGLSPDNPDQQRLMTSVRDNAAEVGKQTSSLAEMRKNGFFDNPGKYLIDRIINMPMAEGNARDALMNTKEASDAIHSQVAALKDRSVVDTQINSADTVDHAAELYKQALSAATAAGIDPLIQGQQIKISAYNLATQQAHLALAQQENARQEALQPGKIALQGMTTQYYSAAKDAEIEKLKATAAIQHQEVLDRVAKNTRDAESLVDVNNVYKYLGLKGEVTDLNRLPKEIRDPTLEMATNLKTSGQIASDPSKALDLLDRSKISLSNLPAGQLPTISALSLFRQQGILEANTTTVPGEGRPRGKDLEDIVQGYVFKKILGEQNNIQTSNKIFAMPSVNTIMERPWAEGNDILQAMKPLTMDASGAKISKDMNGSLLINTASQLVNEGKLTEAQAVKQLSDIGHNVLNDIQTAGGFKRFGIPIQEKFPVMFDKAGFRLTNTHMPVDLYNSADILQKLRLQRAGMKQDNNFDTAKALTGGLN